MYESKQILPNIHFHSTSHEPLLNGKFRMVTELEPFDTTTKVAVNNFGFGGVNAHIVLEDGRRKYAPPAPKQLDADGVTIGRCHVYARTEENATAALQSGVSSKCVASAFKDLDAFPFRGVMSALNPMPVVSRVDTGSKVSLAYVFSGQGSQVPPPPSPPPYLPFPSPLPPTYPSSSSPPPLPPTNLSSSSSSSSSY